MEKFVEKVMDFKKACEELGVLNISYNSKDGFAILVKDFSVIPNIKGVVYEQRKDSYFPVEKAYISDGIKIFTFGSIKELVEDLGGDSE